MHIDKSLQSLFAAQRWGPSTAEENCQAMASLNIELAQHYDDVGVEINNRIGTLTHGQIEGKLRLGRRSATAVRIFIRPNLAVPTATARGPAPLRLMLRCPRPRRRRSTPKLRCPSTTSRQ